MPRALKVLGVRSGQLIGTIELADSGELSGSSPGVLKDFEQMVATQGLTPQEAFENFPGWSNGYIQIVAAEDHES
jgi:hypothetical protein